MSHLSNFLKKVPVRSYDVDEIILMQGQTAQVLYIPIKGIVKVFMLDKQGVERRILSVQKNEPFPSGWMAEPSRPVSYTYQAYTKTKCAVIDDKAMHSLIHEHPKALAELLAYTDRRVEFAKQRIEMLVQGRAEDKILYFLKYTLNRISKPTDKQGKSVINARLTQKEIGESMGLTRETTSRVLREFAEKDIISLGTKQRIFINEDKLRQQIED